MRRSFLLAITLAGCSGDDAPDVPADPGHVVFEAACAQTASIVFPPTSPGQTSMMIVHVVNDGETDVTLGNFTEISGADAGEFEVIYPGNGLGTYRCQGTLPPHAWCQETILFRPTEAGMKTASYEPGGAGSLALSALSVAQPASQSADLASGAYGYILSAPQPFQLRNDTAAPIALGDPIVDPPFLFSSWNCPAILSAGAACMVEFRVQPSVQTTCQSGRFTTTTNSFSVPLSFTPARPFPVLIGARTFGNGQGRVTSTNGDIDCIAGDPERTGCYVQYWKPPASIELLATDTEESDLVAWVTSDGQSLSSCGTAASCTVPIMPSSRLLEVVQNVPVWFALSTDKRIRVNIEGSGIVGQNGAIRCDRSCTLYVAPGNSEPLYAYTAGTFLGWSGDCTGTDLSCSLGTVINDRTVTARFSP